MYRYLLSCILLVHHVMGDTPTSVDDACTLPLDTFYILDNGKVIYHAHTWLSTIKFTWTDGSTVAEYTGNTEFPAWTISDNSISYGLGTRRRRLEDRPELIREQRETNPMPPGLVEAYTKHTGTHPTQQHDGRPYRM